VKRAYIIFTTFIIICLGLSATLVFTKPASLQAAFQLQLATLLLNICGAVLFLLAIKGFRQTVKVAYRFMSAGALMLLAGVIEIYVLLALGLSEQSWSIIIKELPFTLMAIFFYIGVRAFGKLIWARTPLINAPLVLGTATILSVLVGFGPGLFGSGEVYDALAAVRFFGLALFICSLILAREVWARTSPFYRRAFTWFLAFFSLTVFNTFCGFLQEAPWMGWFGPASIILYLAAGVLLSITALQFNRVAYSETGKATLPPKSGTITSVDIIVYLAGFASSPAAIDTILNHLRELTAVKATSDWGPSESEQEQLASIYLSLEDYLVNKEPLRKFEQQALRQMIELQFKDAVNEPLFWKRVPIETMHS
jgi:hypothetical protein